MFDFTETKRVIEELKSKPTQEQRIQTVEETMKLIHDFLSKLGFHKEV